MSRHIFMFILKFNLANLLTMIKVHIQKLDTWNIWNIEIDYQLYII